MYVYPYLFIYILTYLIAYVSVCICIFISNRIKNKLVTLVLFCPGEEFIFVHYCTQFFFFGGNEQTHKTFHSVFLGTF